MLREILIAMEDGVIQDVQLSIGVRLIVHDYDVDGAPADELKRASGRPFVETVWPSGIGRHITACTALTPSHYLRFDFCFLGVFSDLLIKKSSLLRRL